MMPLLLYLYCQGFANLQTSVPYVDIITSLFMILIPCGAGILINYYRPQYAKIITKVSAHDGLDESNIQQLILVNKRIKILTMFL